MIKRFYDFLIQKSVQVSAFLLIILSLFIFIQNDHPSIRRMQGGLANLLIPVKEPAIWFDRQIKAHDENIVLTRRIITLSSEASRFSILADENKRLRRLLDFRNSVNMDMIPALIISSGSQGNLSGLLLNRGLADSIHVNDAILNMDGIVGKIYFVGQNSSLGQILAEPNSRISVSIRPSNAKGILQWYGGNRFVVKDIPNTMQINKDNLVVSSGYSDIYPPDLPVGIVENSVPAADGFTITVYGRLLVDFNRLEEVMILRKNPNRPEFISQP